MQLFNHWHFVVKKTIVFPIVDHGECYRISVPRIINLFFPFSPPHQKQNSSPSFPPTPLTPTTHPTTRVSTIWVASAGSWEQTSSTMSLLPPEVHTALSQLLRALGTPDNTVRSQAEEQLNNDWVQNKPDILLMGLAEQIAGAEDTLVSAH